MASRKISIVDGSVAISAISRTFVRAGGYRDRRDPGRLDAVDLGLPPQALSLRYAPRAGSPAGEGSPGPSDQGAK